jgi:hypothetical protein
LLLTKYFNFVEQLAVVSEDASSPLRILRSNYLSTSLNCRSVRLFPVWLALTVGRLRFYSAHKW